MRRIGLAALTVLACRFWTVILLVIYRFLRDTSHPMSPYLPGYVKKINELETGYVR